MKTIIIFLIASFATFTTHAQKDKGKYIKTKSTLTIQSNYSCPMHSEVKSNKPGKCSKCDMDLALSTKEQMKKDAVRLYTCPMHSEVVSKKLGKCPVCNSNLSLSKKEQMKMETVKLYTCPMHSDVAAKTPGKCSKCGMALTMPN